MSERKRAARVVAIDRTTKAEPVILFERGPDFVERVRNRPRPRWLVPNLVKEDAVTLLHGQPRSMKTFADLELAISVAGGLQAFHLGPFQCEPAPVLYVSEEDPEHEIMDRVEGIARAHHLDQVPKDFILAVRKGVNLDEDQWQEHLLSAIATMGVRLVMLDPTRALTVCVDGGPRDLKPFADFVRRIRRETRAGIILSHHDTKPNPKGEETRDHAQQASGGGIFSISDAPIHAVRQGDGKTLLVPSNFKFAKTDPEPVLVTIETSGEPGELDYEVAVVGEFKRENVAACELVEQKVCAYLRENPCVTQDQLFKAIGGNRSGFGLGLKKAIANGTIVAAKKKKGNGLHHRLPGDPSCGECQ